MAKLELASGRHDLPFLGLLIFKGREEYEKWQRSCVGESELGIAEERRGHWHSPVFNGLILISPS
jgi:hypothetical protein